jgi:hypothetical protein
MIRSSKFGRLNHGPVVELKTDCTSLGSAAQPQKVRFWGEAEVGRQLRPADSVENDPSATLAVEFALMHKTSLVQ